MQGFISSTSNKEGTNLDYSSDEEDNFDVLQLESEDQCTQSQEASGEDIDDGIESEDDFELQQLCVAHQGDVLSSQERLNNIFSQHLQLSTIAAPARKRGQLQPIIDYSKSIRLTDPVHLAQLKVMRDKRQVATKAAEEKKLEYKQKNEECAIII